MEYEKVAETRQKFDERVHTMEEPSRSTNGRSLVDRQAYDHGQEDELNERDEGDVEDTIN